MILVPTGNPFSPSARIATRYTRLLLKSPWPSLMRFARSGPVRFPSNMRCKTTRFCGSFCHRGCLLGSVTNNLLRKFSRPRLGDPKGTPPPSFDSQWARQKYNRRMHAHSPRYFWVPTGNRTQIASSTNSSVNRYTIGTSAIGIASLGQKVEDYTSARREEMYESRMSPSPTVAVKTSGTWTTSPANKNIAKPKIAQCAPCSR